MLIMQPEEILARLADYPIRVFEAGDVVLPEGAATGRLLFLKHGTVDILVEDVLVTRVSEPAAVFGEMAFLLGEAHTAAVLAASSSSFHVVEDPEDFLSSEPRVALYISLILARRLNAVNHLLVEARHRETQAEQRRGRLGELLERMAHAMHLRAPR